jgi:hypothetical protein
MGSSIVLSHWEFTHDNLKTGTPTSPPLLPRPLNSKIDGYHVLLPIKIYYWKQSGRSVKVIWYMVYGDSNGWFVWCSSDLRLLEMSSTVIASSLQGLTRDRTRFPHPQDEQETVNGIDRSPMWTWSSNQVPSQPSCCLMELNCKGSHDWLFYSKLTL